MSRQMRPAGAQGKGAGKTGPFRRGSGSGKAVVEPEELRFVAGCITALEEQKDPRRRSLYVDGQFVLGLDLETVIQAGLRKGQTVDGPALVKAWQMDQLKRAWDGALRLLAVTARTTKGLGQRLLRNWPPEVVEQILERLEAAGWLDDKGYAESYIRSHKAYGARRLLADLIRKGVDRNLAAETVQAALGETDAAEQAREAAAKRLGSMGEVDRETAQRRLIGFLARRGFGPDVISRALTPLLQELPRAERRQEKPGGWRSVEPDRERASSFGRGGSSLRRTSSLQRSRPVRTHDEGEAES